MNIKKLILKISLRGYLNWLPDKQYLKLMYWVRLGEKLNLKNPQTYNEKLQWLKLYDRQDKYTDLVDKYEVKKYISQTIGEEYVIPTLGVWDHFEDIDFDSLPNKFVLKCTHDSGGLVICQDKTNLNKSSARKKIDESLKKNYYYHGREWPYKNVRPRIIAEEYIESDEKTLKDYKFYCFDGKAKMVMINSDRSSKECTKADYFDMNFNKLNLNWGYENAKILPCRPHKFNEMIRLVEEISKGFPELRVDLYNCDGKIYFGEITFFDGSGFDRIEPKEWDYKLGSYISIEHKD